MKRRWYFFDISEIDLKKELSIYSFNNYLMLTMTGGYYIAYLIIFGYANGTDSIIDISPYLIDSQNYDEDLNLIKEIHANITIDNNIFGYIKEDKIKIVSIPEQLKFSIGKDENKVEIENGEIIDVNVEYSLNQINSLILFINFILTL